MSYQRLMGPGDRLMVPCRSCQGENRPDASTCYTCSIDAPDPFLDVAADVLREYGTGSHEQIARVMAEKMRAMVRRAVEVEP